MTINVQILIDQTSLETNKMLQKLWLRLGLYGQRHNVLIGVQLASLGLVSGPLLVVLRSSDTWIVTEAWVLESVLLGMCRRGRSVLINGSHWIHSNWGSSEDRRARHEVGVEHKRQGQVVTAAIVKLHGSRALHMLFPEVAPEADLFTLASPPILKPNKDPVLTYL